VYDNSQVDGPKTLREWILKNYSHQFVEVAAEKLLVYGLGRGAEYQDMPLVRSIARDADANGDRFSALVLSVVKSRPFQMNTKTGPAPASNTASIASTDLDTRRPGRERLSRESN
jgi:hypothetical protein